MPTAGRRPPLARSWGSSGREQPVPGPAAGRGTAHDPPPTGGADRPFDDAPGPRHAGGVRRGPGDQPGREPLGIHQAAADPASTEDGASRDVIAETELEERPSSDDTARSLRPGSPGAARSATGSRPVPACTRGRLGPGPGRPPSALPTYAALELLLGARSVREARARLVLGRPTSMKHTGPCWRRTTGRERTTADSSLAPGAHPVRDGPPEGPAKARRHRRPGSHPDRGRAPDDRRTDGADHRHAGVRGPRRPPPPGLRRVGDRAGDGRVRGQRVLSRRGPLRHRQQPAPHPLAGGARRRPAHHPGARAAGEKCSDRSIYAGAAAAGLGISRMRLQVGRGLIERGCPG